MSNSLTYKQEQFCLNLFKGMTQREAWINAGYSNRYSLADIDSNACRLANSIKIKSRFEELKALATSENVMPEIERKERLSEFARAKLTNFVKVNGDVVEIDLDGPDNAALQEVSIDSWRGIAKDGEIQSRTSKIKLINPIQAIAELNKMEHIYEVGGSNYTDIKVLVMREPERKVIEGEIEAQEEDNAT